MGIHIKNNESSTNNVYEAHELASMLALIIIWNSEANVQHIDVPIIGPSEDVRAG